MDDEQNNQQDSGGAQAWLERMTGRSMGDIRIHDSAQAGDLARRLGARAFTVGRDVYVRSELTNNDTSEGRALLAHEVTHAMEQSGASVADMPLLKPQASKGGFGGSASGGAMPVQRVAASSSSSTPASLPSSEVTAEAVESSAQQSGGGQSGGGGGGGQSGQSGQQTQQNTQSSGHADPEELAERVYALIVHEMLIDLERTSQV